VTIHIREAQLKDAASIVALIRELAKGEDEPSPLTESYAAAYLGQAHHQVLLAEEGGEVVGLLSYSIRPNLYHADPVCEIEELVVHIGARRLGVGSRLIEAVLQRAAANHCQEISVSTLPDNKGAIAFYKRHGFEDEALLLEQHLDH
jgi:ribosomal protein S18 acetylase RimI-like enzyme